MSLRAIVRALGGELYQNGARASISAPGHGPKDRSVSLMISDGRLIVHSFGAADWREVLDDLRRRGFINDQGRFTGGLTSNAAPRLDPSRRVSTARRLWSAGVDTGASGLMARHLALRGVNRAPVSDLLEHPAAPLSVYRPGLQTRRAMMACIRNAPGDLTAVELTYLAPDGRKAHGLRVPRKTVGAVPAGAAVRLSPVGDAMVVAEGVVTTLSAIDRFERPGWALLSASNLARWRPPSEVRDVLIAADRGAAGEAAADRLHHALASMGVSSTIKLPPSPWGDWNEALDRGQG